MKNSADQGGCYPQRPKAEVDNNLRDLQNSSYPTKAEITQPCPQVFSVNGSISAAGCTFDVIDSIWRRFWRNWFNNFRKAPLLTSLIQYGEDSFQIWWTAAGYGKLCVWFKPIRNGKIFWMNNNNYLLCSTGKEMFSNPVFNEINIY